MKAKIIFFILISYFNSKAQNVFLKNSFWSNKTSIEEVKIEVENGNNPVEFNAFNFDATTYAILNKAPIKTIKFLMRYEGNEVDKITHDGRNYLMWAGYKGSYELVEYLISKGSDINLKDDKGNNLQTFTAMGGTTSPEIYDLYIRSGLKLDEVNREGANIILYLSQHVTDLKELEYFIRKGLEINSTDKYGSTIFHYACSQGNVELLKQLILSGLAPNTLNSRGENALFYAAKGKRQHNNTLHVFEFLTSLGLDPKRVNTKGENVLHYIASKNKDIDVFAYLLDQRVDVQKIDEAGNHPLMNAVYSNNEVGISQLYELTKDKLVVNKKGHSLLTYALRNKNSNLVRMLQDEGLDFSITDHSKNNLITHLVFTYSDKNKAFFENHFSELIKKGLLVQQQALEHAVVVESEFLVHTLIDSGAAINARNEDGLSVLQLAAMKGLHTKFLHYLVDKGADKSVKTDFDESVYELAKSNELLKGNLDFLK